MAGEGAIDQVPSRQNSDRSTPSASKPEVDEVAQPPRALDQPNRDAGVADNNPTSDGRMNYGISLSGGGIRAAAFAMGVLQRMEKDEMLRGDKGAKYLSCVSGGSYMGTALTTISRGCFPEEPDDGAEAVPPSSTMPAYAPLSPEVTFLRDNTKYLTHGWGGLPVALWRLLLGIAWNFLLLIMGVLFVAIPIGWVYGALVPSLRALPPSGSVAHTDLDFPPFVFIIAGGLAVIGVILGLVWVGGLWTKARERDPGGTLPRCARPGRGMADRGGGRAHHARVDPAELRGHGPALGERTRLCHNRDGSSERHHARVVLPDGAVRGAGAPDRRFVVEPDPRGPASQTHQPSPAPALALSRADPEPTRARIRAGSHLGRPGVRHADRSALPSGSRWWVRRLGTALVLRRRSRRPGRTLALRRHHRLVPSPLLPRATRATRSS